MLLVLFFVWVYFNFFHHYKSSPHQERNVWLTFFATTLALLICLAH
jgi:hypothetical protein